MRVDRVKFVTELVKKDYSIKKLAKLSGVSAQTLSSIKNGKGCSDETGRAIAEALNMEIEDLFEGK